MKILLTGGGSGGHITPLLAVARDIRRIRPDTVLIAACEKNSKFRDLYEQHDDISAVFEIPAGKYRRYAGESLLRRVTDAKTLSQNTRDFFRTVRGYKQARIMLKRERPDIILIKGGFVAVPVGLAASRLGIPYITHDSDSTPGLANRIISRWAVAHATGLPAELYAYPQTKTIYTGVPVSDSFALTGTAEQAKNRQATGLGGCKKIITVIGGSQGGDQLNRDMVHVVSQLMTKRTDLGIAHIAGDTHQAATRAAYDEMLGGDTAGRVVVTGFVRNVHEYTGAADIVVSRASATTITELGIQQKAVVLVPGLLAGGHQHKNARYFVDRDAALQVESGDREGLLKVLAELLDDSLLGKKLAGNLHKIIKADASQELARLVLAHAEEENGQDG